LTLWKKRVRRGKGVLAAASTSTVCIFQHSVTSIGEEAFYGCHSLASITIPGSVPLGVSAFLNCPGDFATAYGTQG
jgi:hypothetical protein